MSAPTEVPTHLLAPSRLMDLTAMERDFTYKMAQKLTLSLLENGQISLCEYDKISALNAEKFSPFLAGIMR